MMTRKTQRLFQIIMATAFVQALATLGPVARAQDRMDRGGMDRGVGIGTGIGIGIGIGVGRAIEDSQQQQTPATRKPATKPDPGAGLTFNGKPDGVAFNPAHTGGDTANQVNHKNVLVLRDGDYFKRGYYSASKKGGDPNWYWYETAMSRDDPIIPTIPYVASCGRDSDACTMIKREPDVIASDWFWNWWDPPLKVKGHCSTASRKDPSSKIGDLLVTCTNDLGSCKGSCQLSKGGMDIGPSPPNSTTVPGAAGADIGGAECSCGK
jgi:hypothetical protein